MPAHLLCVFRFRRGRHRAIVGFEVKAKIISVNFCTDLARFEFHDVSSKSACFVGKYILDLSKFFIQRCCVHLAGLDRTILIDLEHFSIDCEEVRLHDLDHLNRHEQ